VKRALGRRELRETDAHANYNEIIGKGLARISLKIHCHRPQNLIVDADQAVVNKTKYSSNQL